MDKVCEEFDVCLSSVGSEYLREALKRLQFDDEVLTLRSSQADYISSDKALLAGFKKLISGLGRTKKVSFRDYIFKLEDVKQRSNILHFILILLLLAAIGSIFIKPGLGIIALAVMFIINIATYFKFKSRIEGYFNCVKYLAAMVITAKRISSKLNLNGTPYEEYGADLKRLARTFAPIERGSWLITNSVSGSIADVIMDYIRMLTHIDLIRFNNMRKYAMDHKEDIDELYNILGEIELTICIADIRERSGIYTTPVFNDNAGFKAVGVYHPLIDEPVANTIEAARSVLLTGSNASGKSTFLKCIAINQILAQTLYTCMAEEFITDHFKVLSSMALKDNLLNNESYFIVEIKSLKRIFDELGSKKVMCFVDEVLRGTNTKERIAASTVLLKKLSQTNAFVFAATHDIELTTLLKDYMANYHFSETVTDTVTFDYKLKGGPSTSRNAIKLLKMYGFAEDIVEEAEALAR